MKFNPNDFLKGKKRIPTVCYPSPIENKELELWGYYFEESNYYNVVGTELSSSDMGGVKPSLLGHFYAEKPNNPPRELYGFFSHKELRMGRKVLQSYDYYQKFGKFSVTSSDENVISVDRSKNQLKAIGQGKTEVIFYDDSTALHTVQIEVVDDFVQQVDTNFMKVLIGH